MMGVVLWKDRQDGKAVIWCEDHGKLAYLTGDQAELCADLDMEAGDLVKFSLRIDKRLRFAENVQVVEENNRVGLADALTPEGATPAMSPEPVMDYGADIIPFRAKEQPHLSAQPLAARAGA